MKNKKIVIGITGSIAAYKSIELIRLLCKEQVQVRVVLTQSAQSFVTPLTLQAISGQPVYSDQSIHSHMGMDHIELARWADLFVIAPASANCIAQLAHGFADNLLTSLVLATRAPIAIAPAMNQQMWNHPFTQQNLQKLLNHSVRCWGPGIGEQACGDLGPGRMLEPPELLAEIKRFFMSDLLQNQHIVITAGPSREAIDPVRYLSNYSSGKMGYALAEVAANLGAKVTLITGPTQLKIPAEVDGIRVNSAEQMYQAVMQSINQATIFIGAAAVADYRPQQVAMQKIKKQNQHYQLLLEPTPDILKAVGQLNPRPFIIGFAAETENLLTNAQQKLQHKNADMIIANQVGANQGFEMDENAVVILEKNGCTTEIPIASKVKIAEKILKHVYDHYLSCQRKLASREKNSDLECSLALKKKTK